MAQRSGDELTELEGRQEPRLVKALEMVAPGTALREGLDNILHARTGGLIVIGDPEELSFLFSGGIKLDIDYTPALLYQLAKMDGAIILAAAGLPDVVRDPFDAAIAIRQHFPFDFGFSCGIECRGDFLPTPT